MKNIRRKFLFFHHKNFYRQTAMKIVCF